MKKLSGALLALLCPALAVGGTRYLVVGGGYSPSHSEVVLERNVELFGELADFFRVPAVDRTVLFAAGNDAATADVTEMIANFPDSERVFAFLFAGGGRPEIRLRHNRLTNLAGAASRANVLDRLEAEAAAADGRTPFRFYYTGHGSYDRHSRDLALASLTPGSDTLLCQPGPGAFAPTSDSLPIGEVSPALTTQYRRNFLALWNGDSLNALEFGSALDGFPGATPIQVVMVQCFSGGFAQMMFEKGNPTRPLSSAERCGFFAQVPSRLAAGCSPDINHREEYSPYFFAALRGRTERGEAVDADYDGNGRVTSDEAHAFVLIHENSIDVPITTSSHLLREQGYGIPAGALDAPWSWFARRLSVVELAVVSGLAGKLRVDLARTPAPLRHVRSALAAAQGDVQTATLRHREAARRLVTVLRPMAQRLSREHAIFFGAYPENAAGDQALAEARAAFEAHESFADAMALYRAMKQAEEAVSEAGHRLAKWERLGYALETKVLEARLEGAAPADVKDAYLRLRRCEHRPFFE